jgi:transposase InsO family protein
LHATPEPVVAALLALRRRRPRWGAKKLLWQLAQREPTWRLPALSTAQAILKRHGLVPPRRARRRHAHPGRPPVASAVPNALWTADFKGEFKTCDGRYCYPLTIIDDASRFVLACDALLHPTHVTTQARFRQAFRTYGLPRAIRTDNGAPFASVGLGRLSRLAVWWLRLGITPVLIQPARPDQNGRHERFHKTLKAETTRPPSACRAAQHRRFTRYRHDFNHARPHEALGQVPPAARYTRSAHRLPRQLAPLTYPRHFEQRRVSPNGCIKWHSRFVFVSQVLVGETLGFEERVDHLWDVYFGSRHLGLFHETSDFIEDLTP